MIQQNAVQTGSPTQAQTGGIQIVQQVVNANGEIQQIPVSKYIQHKPLIMITSFNGKKINFIQF